MINCADHWTQPIGGNSTSDYFNICGIDSLLSPSSLPYWQHAYFGNGYAGILLIRYNWSSPFIVDYREYIQGELSQPLIAGQCYYCQFWVELMNFSEPSLIVPSSAIDAIGVLFTDTLPQLVYAVDSMAMYYPTQINNAPGRIISDTTQWTMISDTFMAQGGEKYFTVGAFKKPYDINQIFYGKPNFDHAYYLFDNFSLCPCEDTIPEKLPESVITIPNVFTPNNDGFNDAFHITGKGLESLSLALYNRWGKLVFETNNLHFAWDGTLGGEPCAEGVYYYVAEVVFANGVKESKTGTVTLIR